MKVTESTTKPRAAKVKSEESVIDLEEQIRQRAYELYERRGRGDGHATEDWLQAEAELVRERTAPLPVAAVKKNRKPPVTSAGKAKAMQVKTARTSTQSTTEETRSGN